ncbi:MAG: DUF3108 domain-containing protein, partial [Alistipes sp.]|nr:DUF3108 domain-containing protein [Alistipes sp.]
MKRLLLLLSLLPLCGALRAQLYHPDEELSYRISYKAKMFPNTEVGAVEMTTSETTRDGRTYYLVKGVGRTLPTYRWFYNMEDVYQVWVDPE